MSRRKFVREGDLIPEFLGMLDQNGDFVQIRQYRGKAFVLNFIFTRRQAPTMCPASTTRMSELQEQAREAGLLGLDFVTISFDPLFDSPGVLRQYAKGYGLDTDNFHLLTNTDEKVIEDLLRQFRDHDDRGGWHHQPHDGDFAGRCHGPGCVSKGGLVLEGQGIHQGCEAFVGAPSV